VDFCIRFDTSIELPKNFFLNFVLTPTFWNVPYLEHWSIVLVKSHKSEIHALMIWWLMWTYMVCFYMQKVSVGSVIASLKICGRKKNFGGGKMLNSRRIALLYFWKTSLKAQNDYVLKIGWHDLFAPLGYTYVCNSYSRRWQNQGNRISPSPSFYSRGAWTIYLYISNTFKQHN